MGCYNNRDYPPDSKEQQLQLRVIRHLNLHSPSVKLILQVLRRYPQYYLLLAQANEVARQLSISLDLELVRESSADLRVCRWKMLSALVMCSADSDLQAKKEAFLPLLKGGKRQIMRLLEWRAELLYKRLIDASVKANFQTFIEAEKMKGKEMARAVSDSLELSRLLCASGAPLDDFMKRKLHQVE